ncbi:anthranilate phosphoribosyltransferase [Tessaracoccus sp. MC1756]|uniref:anthranilate phosphoribosyltransferase n=1 Tax=Tessaracoccus sp. MC1756 TaxID=2760311 RepID=UPI0016021A4F|nr:anthranilate phosphoribosyltransferase [Tessaracoccus sp. MC1756]MBB1510064.1 anthranilate phosphoribosyltransferase [Tessaracoccus sp. MC1756]
MITALTHIKTERGALESVVDRLGSIEEVVEIFSITGKWDLLAHIQVPQYENLSDVINGKITRLPGIADTRTVTAFQQHKFRRADEERLSFEPSSEGLSAGRATIAPVLAKLADGYNLEKVEVASVVEAIAANQLTDVQIAGFLVGLTNKGPTVSEVAAIATAMREHALPISVDGQGDLTDLCGTGGGAATFNVSTAASFVAAAGGVRVAKHGSRSISSKSGSADVLEALGVHIDQTPLQAAELIENIGMSFLYAPTFHPIMATVFGPENQLGIKSIFFTIIGPLINPLRARNHIMGVYKPELVPMMAKVIAEMDFRHVLVVHGLDGLDELSLLGATSIADVKDGHIDYREVTPEDFGLKRCRIEDIAGGTPEENAASIRAIFAGEDTGPRRDYLALNAGGALYTAGRVESLRDGVAMAFDLISSGAAQRKLEELVAATSELQ